MAGDSHRIVLVSSVGAGRGTIICTNTPQVYGVNKFVLLLLIELEPLGFRVVNIRHV